MKPTSVFTLVVLKPEILRYCRFVQLENMSPMRVTFPVSNEDRSNDVRLEALQNVLFIVVTFDVLNDDRSNDVRFLHP